jgi:hypothetical protein
MNALIKSTLLGGLVITGLAIGPFEASATSTSTAAAENKAISKDQLYKTLKDLPTEQIAKNFGLPDEMLVLRKPNGEMSGVVWVYRKAVIEKQGGLADARFALIDGKLEYVALSKSM